jgi:hypothetical protein
MPAKKRVSKATLIDPDDVPELTIEWFSRVDL